MDRPQPKKITFRSDAAPAALPAAPLAQKVPLQPADGQAALLALLKVEAEARDAANEAELHYLIANETRKLTRARQIFVLRPALGGALEVKSVSSLASVERNAPLIILIERMVAAAAKSGDIAAPRMLAMDLAADDPTAAAYPFHALAWLPLKHKNNAAVGGVVLAREDAWSEQDLAIAKRLTSAYAHALAALPGTRTKFKRRLLEFSKWHAGAMAAILAALVFVKVPLSALAPVEVIAHEPFVVAAPIDGVIETIAVDANQPVKVSTLLVKLADTALKNKLSVAEREVQVAQARLKQSNQIAFDDAKGMHDLGIARAELALKIAERDYARDVLAKSEIRAERDGIAIYSDKRDLTGKPVAVGERILEVASEQAIEARIDLPVADAIALMPGMRVKLFLDSDPLRPWHATVTRADYKAKAADNDVVAFRVVAAITAEQARALPRLGVRGTAQISGDDVALGFFIFRRPITAFRQWSGF